MINARSPKGNPEVGLVKLGTLYTIYIIHT